MKLIKSLTIVFLVLGINFSVFAKDDCRDKATKAEKEECRKMAKEAKDKVKACITKAKEEHKETQGSCKEMSSKDEQKKCRLERSQKVDNAIRACRAG